MRWDSRWVQFFFGLWVGAAFMTLGIIQLPIMLIVEHFILPEERAHFWRLVCHRHSKLLLRMMRIRLDLRTPVPKYDHPVIFVSNHPSNLDGFICFALLGPDLISLIAPYNSFPFPFNMWMRKAGAVDISRDTYDERCYPGARTKKQAVEDLISSLNAGYNLLIFPEGHVERTAKLHYIHTGAARVAIRSKCAVAPMSLIGVDQILLGGPRVKPGTITVRFDGLIQPPTVSHELPFRRAVKQFSKEIEHAMVTLLPVRYLPDYINEYTPESIGVFIDIDQTIYKGYSQQDFIKYLRKHHHIRSMPMLRVFYWLLLEKLRAMSHRQLMRRSLGMMRGWKVNDVEHLAQVFFQNEVVQHVQAHMLPLIKDHKSRGHIIVLVTEVIHPLARIFKDYIGASGCLDTVIIQKNGVYTGEVERLCWSEGKAELVEQFAKEFGIDLQKSYAYADSISDGHLFATVKHKTVVNPAKEFKALAQQYGWEILA